MNVGDGTLWGWPEKCAEDVEEVTRNSVEVAFVDEGYSSESTPGTAKPSGIELIVVKLPDAKKGMVLLPRRWVVECSFA